MSGQSDNKRGVASKKKQQERNNGDKEGISVFIHHMFVHACAVCICALSSEQRRKGMGEMKRGCIKEPHFYLL